jgi:hypothetical protein
MTLSHRALTMAGILSRLLNEIEDTVVQLPDKDGLNQKIKDSTWQSAISLILMPISIVF